MDFGAAAYTNYWQEPDSPVKNLALGMIPGPGDNSPGPDVMGPNGSVQLGSGALLVPMPLIHTGGIANGSRMTIGMKYNSYLLFPKEDEDDKCEADPTLPFGLGWNPTDVNP